MIRNVIHPGWVVSINDGDRHFIGYGVLIRLYGLNPSECVDYSNTQGWSRERLAAAAHFYPSREGNYLREERQ
jgi:hypothetical protein